MKNPTRSNTRTAWGLAPWAQWAAATLFWVFITVLSNLQIWLISRQPGEQFPVRQVLTLQSVFYLAWIPFTVPLWRLVARWDPGALGAWRWIALHLGGAAAVAFLHTLVVMIVVETMVDMPGGSFGRSLLTQLRGRVYLLVIIYAGIIASGLAFTLYARWRDRAAAAALLEHQLADARLSALRAQLHPHFLFNSLHAIASLVRESRNAEAVRLISGMSDLLRRVLDTTASVHAVDDEVALVRTYLEIQQARFGDRLSSTVDVSPEAAAARVPVLLIQPLVENALRHGLANKVAPGRVEVDISRARDELVVTVEDDGVGVEDGWRLDSATGTGLSNLRARLSALHGSRASLDAGPRASGGFTVTVRLPWQAR